MINDQRTLAAKFQKAWSQIFCGCLCDDTAHSGRTSKANQIEREVVNCDSDINGALDGHNELFVEVFVREFFNSSTCLWRHF